MNFNPRSHGGSDFLLSLFQPPFNISIHAPTGGATCHTPVSNRYIFISIHAPTGGATSVDTRGQNYQLGFQSTLPRGERRTKALELFIDRGISIHAPTGGATISQAKSETAVYNFNPRSHGGSDLFSLPISSIVPNFNPRSHGGSD